jgi:hypothetical protein
VDTAKPELVAGLLPAAQKPEKTREKRRKKTA